MLHTEFQAVGQLILGRRFSKVFTIYECGGHIGQLSGRFKQLFVYATPGGSK